MNAFRTIYRWWLTLMFAAIIVQIGFAGLGVFDALDKASAGSVDEDGFLDSFFPHAVLGQLLVLGSLVMLILALVARVGKRRVLLSLGLFVLFVAQMFLGWTGQDLPAVLGLLHPLNAFFLLAAIGYLMRSEWMLARGGEPAARPAVAPPPAA
jgi:Family of unknown function (DUF6220)